MNGRGLVARDPTSRIFGREHTQLDAIRHNSAAVIVVNTALVDAAADIQLLKRQQTSVDHLNPIA